LLTFEDVTVHAACAVEANSKRHNVNIIFFILFSF
jgi:hypothetical protein